MSEFEQCWLSLTIRKKRATYDTMQNLLYHNNKSAEFLSTSRRELHFIEV